MLSWLPLPQAFRLSAPTIAGHGLKCSAKTNGFGTLKLKVSENSNKKVSSSEKLLQSNFEATFGPTRELNVPRTKNVNSYIETAVLWIYYLVMNLMSTGCNKCFIDFDLPKSFKSICHDS